MGNLFTGTLGKVLTELLGKVLTEGVGNVLDIYRVPQHSTIHTPIILNALFTKA